MCKHVVYTTIVNFQMNIVYRRKIKNRKKKKKKKKIASTREISESSAGQIAKHDLGSAPLKRIKGQKLCQVDEDKRVDRIKNFAKLYKRRVG